MSKPDSISAPPAAPADSQTRSLYRPEALRAHQSGPRPRRRSQWLDPEARRRHGGGWAFYGLLGLAVLALATAAWVPIDQRVTGDAVVRLAPGGDPSTASDYMIHASFPAERRAQLAVGQPLSFEGPHTPDRNIPNRRLEARITTVLAADDHQDDHQDDRGQPALVQVEAGLEAASLKALGQAPLRDGLRGRASVPLGRTSFVRRLAPSPGAGASGGPR